MDNTQPILTADGINPTFSEATGLHVQATPVFVFQNAQADTNDSGQTITGLTFTVTGLKDGVNESIVVDGKTIGLGGNSTGLTTTNGMDYTVTFSGDSVTVVLTGGDGISAENTNVLINNITYQNTRIDDPTAGYRDFTLTLIKDNGGSPDTTPLAIVSRVTVSPKNDAPVSTDDSVTMPEDTITVLTLDDFGSYSDAADGASATSIAKVKITTLESDGSLEYNHAAVGDPVNWQPVERNQIISKVDIEAGRLRFVPDSNENGAPYSTTGFKVSDELLFSADAYTLTVTVTPVNDPPTSSDDSVLMQEDTIKVLAMSDFGIYSDTEAAAIAGVKITTLELNGSLEYNNAPDGQPVNWIAVTLNQEITKADIDAGKLRFVPDSNEYGSPSYATTGFRVSDGTEYSTTAYTLTVAVTPVNDAPVLKGDLAAPVNEGGRYTLTGADLGYTDPDDVDADEIFKVGTQTNGKIQVTGVDVTSFTGTQLMAGDVTFIHDGSETTIASFKVSVEDGNEDNSTPVESTFTFAVTPVNDAPVLKGDLAAPINEGGRYTLTGEDLGYIDPDDVDAGEIFKVGTEMNGKIQVTGVDVTSFTGTQLVAGDVTFIHDSSETTIASFKVSVEDGNEDNSTPAESTFTFVVTPVNDAPVAHADMSIVNEDATLMVSAADGVILSSSFAGGKDTDVDGGTLTVIGVVSGTAANAGAVGTSHVGTLLAGTYGHLMLNADGSYSYVADTNAAIALIQGETATDTFSYAVSDGFGGTSFSTLMLTVTGNNDLFLSIDDTTVSEADGTATFTVTRTGNDMRATAVDFSAGDATAKAGSDYTATSGTLSFAAGEMSKLVTVSIINDTLFEPSELFSVTLSNPHSGTSLLDTIGIGTIKDNDASSDPLTGPIVVSGKDDVSEGSNAIFTVTLNETTSSVTEITLTLGSLLDDAKPVEDYSGSMSAYYFVGTVKHNLPPVASNGQLTLPVGVKTFFVIVPTLDDNPVGGTGLYEGAERFTLTAVTTGDQSDSDTATILDDGTGQVYGFDALVDPNGASDNDAFITIEDVTVNERSPYVVFQVKASSNILFMLSFQDGVATFDNETDPAGIDFGHKTDDNGQLLDEQLIQFYNGLYWEDYTQERLVNVPEGGSVLLVRVPVHNDAVYEGAHNFTLKVTPSGSPLPAVTGSAVIVDDGTGAVFNDSGAEDRLTGIIKDDDRPLKVDSPIVNEASDFALFTVKGVQGSVVTLALGFDSDPNTDNAGRIDLSDKNIQWWNGTSWLTYDGSGATIPASGELLVRIGIKNEQDPDLELPEIFVLKVSQGTEVLGLATILDDGTGVIYTFPGTESPYNIKTDGLDDDHDQDGIAPTTETALATMAASQGIGDTKMGDLNGDGIQDAVQNALATLAWRHKADFEAGNNGTLIDTAPIISIGVVDTATATGKQISSKSQLIDIVVSTYEEIDTSYSQIGTQDDTIVVTNNDGTKTVTLENGSTVTTPWDPLRFEIEVRDDQQGTSLTDIDGDPTNGTQVRVLIDVRASGLTTADANAYIKYVSADAIAASATPLQDLDHHDIIKAGWYDFTQRVAGGDGAKFVVEGDKIVGIELIITDNAFGDNDMAPDKIFDPGVLANSNVPFYRVDLPSGDRMLFDNQTEANAHAAPPGTIPRIEFYGVPDIDTSGDTVALKAWHNPITGDYFYAPENVDPPYECYEPLTPDMGRVLTANSGRGVFDVHLYMNGAGITQIMGEDAATSLGLETQGYVDKGVLFQSVADIAPTVIAFNPGDGGVNVPVGNDIVLAFSEPVLRGVAATAIALHTVSAVGPVVPATLSFSGNILRINPDSDLATDTHYFVTLDDGSVVDLAGSTYAGTSDYDFWTGSLGADIYAGDGSSDSSTGTVLGGVAALGVLAWLVF